MASGQALFDPFLPEFHADPYPFYHRLRAVDPVYQTPMGFWVLTKYDDVVTVLRDPRFGRDAFEQMLAVIYGDDTAESSTLLRERPGLAVAATPTWRESSTLRGLKTLPVTF
jgi:hypothetical protein